jgi:hypothetical protein
VHTTPEARALEGRDRATSRGCLAPAKALLASIMRHVRGEEEIPLVIGDVTSGRSGNEQPSDAMARLARRFLSDPSAVLADGCYAMTLSPDFANAFPQTPRLPANEGGPDHYLVEQRRNATVRIYSKHQSYPGARQIEVVESLTEDTEKVCFLPWQESKLTYRRLDDDADLALTGPLNGCSVYVVRVEAEEESGTYLFHVNANEQSDGDYIRAQRAKFTAALTSLWPETARTVTHRLDFSNYRPSEGSSAEAIVYGTRNDSGEWDFYYYVLDVDESGGCKRRSSTPAGLPRVR